jgi:hypothetical protein
MAHPFGQSPNESSDWVRGTAFDNPGEAMAHPFGQSPNESFDWVRETVFATAKSKMAHPSDKVRTNLLIGRARRPSQN